MRLLRLQRDLPVARAWASSEREPSRRRWLEDAAGIARGAGAILREGYGRPVAIDSRARIDLVTEFDRRERGAIIKAELARRFPGTACSAEEDGRATAAGDEYRWLVDPLDGTTNFAHAYPFFCVSIALEQSTGERVLGVVYDPLRDECFAARAGAGATLNGAPIRVSRVGTLARALGGDRLPLRRAREARGDAALLRAVPAARAAACGATGLGGAQPGLPRVRAVRPVLGGEAPRLGRGGGRPCWSRRPAAASPTSRAARCAPDAVEIAATNGALHAELLARAGRDPADLA